MKTKTYKRLIIGSPLERPVRYFGCIKKYLKECRKKSLPNFKGKLVFLHMPKCAGSSIIRAIQDSINLNPRSFDIHNLRKSFSMINNLNNDQEFYAISGSYQEFLLLYNLHEGFPFISGHYTISDVVLDKFNDEYKFLTVLRDPVERFISQYIYDKLHEIRKLNFSKKQITKKYLLNDLENYIRSWRGRFVSHIYSWTLGGFKFTENLCSKKVTDIAMQSIKNFDVVGFTDSLNIMVNQIEKLFGFSMKIGRYNTSQSVSNEISVDRKIFLDLFTPRIREQIAKLCRADYELYTFARAHFLSDYPVNPNS